MCQQSARCWRPAPDGPDGPLRYGYRDLLRYRDLPANYLDVRVTLRSQRRGLPSDLLGAAGVCGRRSAAQAADSERCAAARHRRAARGRRPADAAHLAGARAPCPRSRTTGCSGTARSNAARKEPRGSRSTTCCRPRASSGMTPAAGGLLRGAGASHHLRRRRRNAARALGARHGRAARSGTARGRVRARGGGAPREPLPGHARGASWSATRGWPRCRCSGG